MLKQGGKIALNVSSCKLLNFIQENLLKLCESNEAYNRDGLLIDFR